MSKCEYCINEICVNADCPMRADYCPVPNTPEVCKWEKRECRLTPFTVIDKETGNYPNCEKIALTEEWAKHLIYCDVDTFAITEDGILILLDDCGNCAYCPADRFVVVFEKE